MKIRPRRYKSGKVAWQADLGMVDGKRKMISCASEAEARKEITKAKKKRERHGEAAMRLSSAEMADVILARDKLAEAGATLNQAADFYLKHHKHVNEVVLVPELVDRFIKSREDLKESKRYVRQLKVSLKSLGRACPLVNAAELTKAQIQAWQASNGWGPVTRNKYMGDVRAMCNWAVDEHYLSQSPCAGIGKITVADKEIIALNPEEAESLLRAAAGDAEMTWYIVIGLLGGVRREEVARMKVAAVNLEEGTVIVRGDTAKTGSRRVVELTPNALAWLLDAPAPAGEKICGKQFAERWVRFRRRLGWAAGNDASKDRGAAFRREIASIPAHRGKWPKNALRRTCASMHYALHQNESLLKAQLGHWEDSDMLHRSYRAVRTKREAVIFYSLRPIEGPPSTARRGA